MADPGVWFCGTAVVFLSLGEDLLPPATVTSGLVLLSSGRLEEVEDDEEDVGEAFLLESDLVA